MILRSILLFSLLFLVSRAEAASTPGRNGLDTAAIRKTYMDGDFDQATEDIERALRRGGPFSHQDSVFIYKHLGVMYAAKYETREKGKHYMYMLLTVEPAAKILDMYASDMIYMIFKNIQNEFEASQGRLLVDNGSPRPAGNGNEGGPRKVRRSLAWVGWTAGVVAAAGGVALALHLMDDPGSSPRENTAE
jgi:hypothetical protein